MANLYLQESLDTPAVGSEVAVEGAEARHAVTVSRTRVGERLSVGNGRGLVASGMVRSADPSRVVIMVEAVSQTAAATPRITLIQALAKGGRDELAIQTATELGVDEVVPWSAERSISRWDGQKAPKGRERWASIVREAAKQSTRHWLVEVAALASTDDVLARAAESRMLLLDPAASTPLSSLRFDHRAASRAVSLVVGPEGGLTPGELERLSVAGAEPVSLGSNVLRTSSAGPAALAVLNIALGRW